MKNGKRNPLSDLTNNSSTHFSSSSSTVQPNNNTSILRKTRLKLNPLLDVVVKPLSLPSTKNPKKELALRTPLTVRCKKKQRGVPNEQVEFQDFIEKQKAYYKEIDEFELEEEEVESVDE
ncbi:hypothetical protein MtrunA17_Chr3g0114441 [Medicago truncatula]|uniref:Uncharacterized protein n=1 Tax=Medicago truncatula TaxID=3880 RepID=G7J2Y5_MEDTR|nr:uncharacterized protein LOC11415869 [Medicago truncatula]AES71278.1 hypothetical protein MTR_3g072180 [Medicago truncatula]RHN68487.1 hypothetical protein MtrunA17_Chr3g0114441 [Medicago truncatula]